MKSTENQPLANKSFWNSISPFLTNKNVRNDDVITLKEKGRLTNDDLEVVETLNSHYINIVEMTCGQPPQALGNPEDQANGIASFHAIISNYNHHPSINQIIKKCSNPKIYSFPEAKKEELNILIKHLNPKKATGPDGIPLKIIKLSADVIDKHLTNTINTYLGCSCFSENAKITSVKPIYKKESRSNKNNYRTVSILNHFSKIYERFMNDKLLNQFSDIVSDFVTAYRSKYSSNHMILRLIEEWKEKLDKRLFAGAVLMDLSKAFHCIPHDLLIAKLNACGFGRKSLVFFYSYLKRRKQCVTVFLNRSRGFYFFFLKKNCGLYSKAAYIQGRLLLCILLY